MQVFFDIQSSGELHLDPDGLEFRSLGDAHAYLVQTLRVSMRLGHCPDYLAGANTVIDITDRGKARRTLLMSELMAQLAEPLPMAA